MIAYVEGTILEKSTSHMVLVTAGVGYQIEIPLQTYIQLGDIGTDAALYIFTLVREDAIRLFGFISPDDKRMFEVLISLTRIGPKMALAILSAMSAHALYQSVRKEDIHALAAIPGLGKKTAERLLFELKSRLDDLHLIPAVTDEPDSDNATAREIVSVLKNLGYRDREAAAAVKTAIDSSDTDDFQKLIRKALKLLSGRKGIQ